jgi:hypothetical protein
MADIKHVGRMAKTGKKCIVVFRTLPGDAFNCLVVLTESLSESYHDALINLVDSIAAQTSNELSEVLARSVFPDGSTMLPSLHAKGLLVKVPTDAVEMIPNSKMSILLSELNQIIAEQLGMSVQDLGLKDMESKTEVKEIATAKDISPETAKTTDLGKTTSSSINESAEMGPEQLAKKYRSDADRLSKEAAQLRRMADELVPIKKKVAVKE